MRGKGDAQSAECKADSTIDLARREPGVGSSPIAERTESRAEARLGLGCQSDSEGPCDNGKCAAN